MSDIILSYLTDLEKNNNREWYHAHKDQNKAAQNEFEELIQALIFEIGKFDSAILHNNPKDLTFKLVRDTRFSHDKSPYNPAFRCHIASAGKLPVPTGYFLSIQPNDQSFLGGGLFADMFKDATKMVREHIFNNADEFLSIVNNPNFCNTFKVMGTALKNVPKEYPANCCVAEYLKYKSWYIEFSFPACQFENRIDFISFAAEKYGIMKPFNDFLNRALFGFSMPTR
ncbi:MAG: DUF2461 domain-containing protein [Lachnospiraceae bacterium]|nr:DUF2461 domain-containing protein [Lachnospiraceae bacterium]